MGFPASSNDTGVTADRPDARGARSDAELVAGIRLGHTATFERVFTAWYEPLVRFAYAYVKSHEVAEEVVQDVFLTIWETRAALDVRGPIAHYLYRAVKNRALNVKRRWEVEDRWQTMAAHEGGATAPGADVRVRESELADAIRRVIGRLPARCRAVYVMSREQHMRHAEIAVVLGITPKAVDQHLWRAMKALRRHLTVFLPSGLMVLSAVLAGLRGRVS
jgi:RNA polymerase sigma-70 factor (ECF subfamily)